MVTHINTSQTDEVRPPDEGSTPAQGDNGQPSPPGGGRSNEIPRMNQGRGMGNRLMRQYREEALQGQGRADGSAQPQTPHGSAPPVSSQVLPQVPPNALLQQHANRPPGNPLALATTPGGDTPGATPNASAGQQGPDAATQQQREAWWNEQVQRELAAFEREAMLRKQGEDAAKSLFD